MGRFRFRVCLKLETKSILLYSSNVDFANKLMILSGKDFKKQIEFYNLTPKDYEILYTYVYEEEVDYNPDYFVKFDDIEQGSGLRDKNGKLIYAGDILEDRWKNDGYPRYYKVIFEDGAFNAEPLECNDWLDSEYLSYISQGALIIGNIHEELSEK